MFFMKTQALDSIIPGAASVPRSVPMAILSVEDGFDYFIGNDRVEIRILRVSMNLFGYGMGRRSILWKRTHLASTWKIVAAGVKSFLPSTKNSGGFVSARRRFPVPLYVRYRWYRTTGDKVDRQCH